MRYAFATGMLIHVWVRAALSWVRRVVLVTFFMTLLHACAPGPASLPGRNKFVGLTNRQIVAQLGVPTAQFVGPYGTPAAAWAGRHKQQVTYLYIWPSGTLYLSIEPAGAQWICVCSNRLPKGGAF